MKIVKSEFTCIREGLVIRGTMFRPEGNHLPIVVVSHGFMANQKSVMKYARQFAMWGYAAFCFDFNGGCIYGKSDGKTTDMSVLTEREDLKAVIVYAKELKFTDSDRIMLMGCSQGGFVSALTAAQMSEQISGLILFYPALCIPDDARRGRMMMAEFDPDNIPKTIKCGPMKLGRCYPADVKDMDPFEEISVYKGPVFIVHGDADKIVDVSYAVRAKEAYMTNVSMEKPSESGCRLQIIEGAGHGFDRQADKAALAGVWSFLRGDKETTGRINIGTQTFGLSKEMAKDLPGTIKALHEIGFNTIEPLILFQSKQGKMPRNLWALDTLEEAKRRMAELGMVMLSAHIGIGFGKVSMPAGMVVRNILKVHQRTGIRYFVVSGPFGDVVTARKWGKLLQRISEGIRPYGCKIVYHNHNDEFNREYVDGNLTEMLEYFFDEAGPDVLLQLDIGWAGFAGDEMAAVKKYQDRICSIHLKDFYPAVREKHYARNAIPDNLFAPIGEGCIRIFEALQKIDTFPNFNGSILIDQDKYAGDMLEALKAGYANVREMLGKVEINCENHVGVSAPCEDSGEKLEECTESVEEKVKPDRDRFSLMTFPLAQDFIRKTMTIQDSFRLAKEAGIPSVDVMNVRMKKMPEYLEAIRSTGVKVKCYISTISFLNRRKAIEKALDHEMATAHALGAPLFMIVPYYPIVDVNKARRVGRDRLRRRLVGAFRLAVEKGKTYDLQVCFETTPQEQVCLSGTEDCRYVLERVPGLSLVFDTANMLPHGDSPLEAYEALKKYIVHVHLKDVMLIEKKTSPFQSEISADGKVMVGAVWGQGVIPIKEIYERMLSDGYQGNFAIEYVHPEGGACGIAAHKRQLKKFFGDVSK